ncbi:phosphatidylethanolamine-binding protein [Phlyctema vagabunda]|uniref:Phosphatidylethanolamine-binding protein n=1 Tax=Phlyctema vagabunda TaxID=108571 RepID=A0ABR4P1P5_9HELO
MPSSKIIKSGLALLESDSSKLLGVQVGEHVVTPGLYIPKSEAQLPPDISFSMLSTSKDYLVVSLDPDAPFPSFSVLGPILHWIQPELKPTPETGGTGNIKLTSHFVADYIGPAPPLCSWPHKYVFLLFEQPTGFDSQKYSPSTGDKIGLGARMRYDLDRWAAEINLGPVIAVNYFLSN